MKKIIYTIQINILNKYVIFKPIYKESTHQYHFPQYTEKVHSSIALADKVLQ